MKTALVHLRVPAATAVVYPRWIIFEVKHALFAEEADTWPLADGAPAERTLGNGRRLWKAATILSALGPRTLWTGTSTRPDASVICLEPLDDGHTRVWFALTYELEEGWPDPDAFREYVENYLVSFRNLFLPDEEEEWASPPTTFGPPRPEGRRRLDLSHALRLD